MFLAEVRKHNQIKDTLAPYVKTTVDEIGTMAPGSTFPTLYWVASASYNVYLYLALARENIDVVGWSQLAAYPSIPSMGLQARDPSVAMLNYTTGEGNARYHALKMMIEYTGAGDALVETILSDNKDVYAQGFTSKKDSSALTIVLGNKSVKEQQAVLHVDPKEQELTGCTTHTVDGLTGDGPPRQGRWDARSPIALGPFAIAVVRCKASI